MIYKKLVNSKPNLIVFSYNGLFNFDAEIKLLANEKYIESSPYKPKTGKAVLSDVYRHKQADVASVAFQQESLTNGLIIYLCKSSLKDFFLF
jgi:hypothetical protein